MKYTTIEMGCSEGELYHNLELRVWREESIKNRLCILVQPYYSISKGEDILYALHGGCGSHYRSVLTKEEFEPWFYREVEFLCGEGLNPCITATLPYYHLLTNEIINVLPIEFNTMYEELEYMLDTEEEINV